MIDYVSYAAERGIEYNPWSFHSIPVSVFKEIAAEKGIEFRRGDILFLRTGKGDGIVYESKLTLAGFITKYESLEDHEIQTIMSNPAYQYSGMKGSLESLEWLWNSHFAAVAGDCPGFESWSKYKCLLLSAVGC